MTQEKWVLNYLKIHKNGLTPLEAYLKYGIMRLSAIIFNLKKKGIKRGDFSKA